MGCHVSTEIHFKGRLISVFAVRCLFVEESFKVIKGKPLDLSEDSENFKELVKNVWPKQCPCREW